MLLFQWLTDPTPGGFQEVWQLAVDLEAALIVQSALRHLLQTFVQARLMLLATLPSFHLENNGLVNS